MLFNNLKIGPVVAIDDLSRKQEHYWDILEKGFVPIAFIEDENNAVLNSFQNNKNTKDFKTKAVFITVYYNKPYE